MLSTIRSFSSWQKDNSGLWSELNPARAILASSIVIILLIIIFSFDRQTDRMQNYTSSING